MINSRRLRELIAQSDMSQEDVARQADVALNTINRLVNDEDSNPTLHTLRSIAKVLRVSIH